MMYKLNRNAFKASTAQEAAESHASYYKNQSWQERLKVTIFLNSIAFQIVGKSEPRIDKTAFKARSRN